MWMFTNQAGINVSNKKKQLTFVVQKLKTHSFIFCFVWLKWTVIACVAGGQISYSSTPLRTEVIYNIIAGAYKAFKKFSRSCKTKEREKLGQMGISAKLTRI